MSAFSLATILEDAEVSQTEPGGMSNVSFCCRMWILDDLPWKKRTVIRSHWHLEVSFCLSWRILNVRSCQMLFSYEARRFLVLSAAFLCSFGFDVDLKQSHRHCRHIYIYTYTYIVNIVNAVTLRKSIIRGTRNCGNRSAGNGGWYSISQQVLSACLSAEWFGDPKSFWNNSAGWFPLVGLSWLGQVASSQILWLCCFLALWHYGILWASYWLYCVSRLDPGTIWSNDVSIQARSPGSSAWATQVACKSAPYSKNTSTLLDCKRNGVTVVWNQLWSRLDQWNSNLTWWPTVSISPDTRFAYDWLKHQVNSTSNTRNRPMHISNHFHTSWSPFARRWCQCSWCP